MRLLRQARRRWAPTVGAMAALLLCGAGLCDAASAQPVDMAAPYLYLGWGEPQSPAAVIEQTGVPDLTLAFMLSHGRCDPEWEGSEALLGGANAAAIKSVREAGGDVDVSFGGWSGHKLGSSCKTPQALAAAYQKVIAAYSLKAIDIDIENHEMANSATRARVAQALAIVQSEDPSLEISVTMGTSESGPESDGLSLISDAAADGMMPTAWTVMPFDFGAPKTDMGHASIRSVEGLAADLVAAYRIPLADAYEHSGISSMNGHTDEKSEIVTLEDFETIRSFAQSRHLARLSFWSVNRDRPCSMAKECSGIEQAEFAFTDLLAQYHG